MSPIDCLFVVSADELKLGCLTTVYGVTDIRSEFIPLDGPAAA